jgi:hypothetical protein
MNIMTLERSSIVSERIVVYAKQMGSGRVRERERMYVSARLMLPPDDGHHSICVCGDVYVCCFVSAGTGMLLRFVFMSLTHSGDGSIEIHHGNGSALLH